MDIDSAPRIVAFAARYGYTFARKLGFGREGDVLASNRPSAVKFFHDQRAFDRELQVYQVLADLNIKSIAGHHVPELIRPDVECLAIEMSIVTTPFLLDFAGARLEHEIPDFEPHVEDEHHARLIDLYGDRWQDVLAVADAFARETGYMLMDIKPGNISF